MCLTMTFVQNAAPVGVDIRFPRFLFRRQAAVRRCHDVGAPSMIAAPISPVSDSLYTSARSRALRAPWPFDTRERQTKRPCRSADVPHAIGDQLDLKRFRHHLDFSEIRVREAPAEVAFAAVSRNDPLDARRPSSRNARKIVARSSPEIRSLWVKGTGDRCCATASSYHGACRSTAESSVRASSANTAARRDRPLGWAQHSSELHQAMDGERITQTVDAADDDKSVGAACDEVLRRGECGKRARTSGYGNKAVCGRMIRLSASCSRNTAWSAASRSDGTPSISGASATPASPSNSSRSISATLPVP